MAKNNRGFILKRYPQPLRYQELFCYWNAIYQGRDGKEYMIEAKPHFLCGEKLGALIDHYKVLRREETCRRVLADNIKSQKQAIEILSRYCNI